MSGCLADGFRYRQKRRLLIEELAVNRKLLFVPAGCRANISDTALPLHSFFKHMSETSGIYRFNEYGPETHPCPTLKLPIGE